MKGFASSTRHRRSARSRTCGWLWLTGLRRGGVNHFPALSRPPESSRSRWDRAPLPTPLFRLGVPTHAVANREVALRRGGERRSRAMGDLRRSPSSRAPGAGVNHLALRIASFQRQWLPKAYGFANSGKREPSVFPTPPGHVSVRNTVLLGVRSGQFCELWCSLVNREGSRQPARQAPGSGTAKPGAVVPRRGSRWACPVSATRLRCSRPRVRNQGSERGSLSHRSSPPGMREAAVSRSPLRAVRGIPVHCPIRSARGRWRKPEWIYRRPARRHCADTQGRWHRPVPPLRLRQEERQMERWLGRPPRRPLPQEWRLSMRIPRMGRVQER